jgi:site-specific recombinase XerC
LVSSARYPHERDSEGCASPKHWAPTSNILNVEREHPMLRIVGEGLPSHHPARLADRSAIDLDIWEREPGPILVGAHGQRLDGYPATRIVKWHARAAGIDMRIAPHSLRHSFITAALDAGGPLRDVQDAASYADPASRDQLASTSLVGA